MNKEFIPYNLSLELKELGFDEPCFKGYTEEYKTLISFSNTHTNTSVKNTLPTKPFTAPLYQQAFRWFREKYHIIGEVKFKGGKTTKTAWYDYIIYSEIDWNDENQNEQWKKHEEAELECLKKLIEIVKEKSL